MVAVSVKFGFSLESSFRSLIRQEFVNRYLKLNLTLSQALGDSNDGENFSPGKFSRVHFLLGPTFGFPFLERLKKNLPSMIKIGFSIHELAR